MRCDLYLSTLESTGTLQNLYKTQKFAPLKTVRKRFTRANSALATISCVNDLALANCRLFGAQVAHHISIVLKIAFHFHFEIRIRELVNSLGAS